MNDQLSTLAKKIGTLTTNHTSRAANSASRASDRRLMPLEFERMPVKGAFFLAWPIVDGRKASTKRSTINTAVAIVDSAPRNPNAESKKPGKRARFIGGS